MTDAELYAFDFALLSSGASSGCDNDLDSVNTSAVALTYSQALSCTERFFGGEDDSPPPLEAFELCASLSNTSQSY